jgi:signal transduction histidine kinase
MTGDGSEHGGSANEPGDVVASAISDITDAHDADAVATAAARGLSRLAAAPVDCFLHDADGAVVATGASDGTRPTDRRSAVDVTAVPETEHLSWPADPLVVRAGDAGWLVCWADDAATAPSWAVRSIASTAVDAARQRASRRCKDDRIAALETETDQLADFASIVAHDLRNPLAIAQGHLELARERGDPEHYEKIGEAHDRIERIIDHTLSMAKREDPVTTRYVETGIVAEDAWETVETGSATLTVLDSVRVQADGDRLQQLFENLFRNSVEHAAPDDSPLADTHGDATDGGVADAPSDGRTAGLAVRVGTLPGGGFFVEDDGSGISADERDSVFERGYSRDGGTGLGLSIVAEIADEHDWSVTVTDGAEGGARFEVTDGE